MNCYIVGVAKDEAWVLVNFELIFKELIYSSIVHFADATHLGVCGLLFRKKRQLVKEEQEETVLEEKKLLKNGAIMILL